MKFEKAMLQHQNSYSKASLGRRLELCRYIDRLHLGEEILSLEAVSAGVFQGLLFDNSIDPSTDREEEKMYDGILGDFRSKGGVFSPIEYIFTSDFEQNRYTDLLESLSPLELIHAAFGRVGIFVSVPAGFQLGVPLQNYFHRLQKNMVFVSCPFYGHFLFHQNY